MQSPRISATLVAPSSTTSAPRGSCSNRLRELNKNMIHNAHCITLHVLVPPASKHHLLLFSRWHWQQGTPSPATSWLKTIQNHGSVAGKDPPHLIVKTTTKYSFSSPAVSPTSATRCIVPTSIEPSGFISRPWEKMKAPQNTSHLSWNSENMEKMENQKNNNTKHPGAGKATCQCWSSKSSGKRKLATRSRSSLTGHLARLKKRFVTSDRLWPLREKHGEGWANLQSAGFNSFLFSFWWWFGVFYNL